MAGAQPPLYSAAAVKSELMQKFLADIPASMAAAAQENVAKSSPFDQPKMMPSPLDVLAQSVNSKPADNGLPENLVKFSPENLPKFGGENVGKGGENPLFSAALQQLARDSRTVNPALLQQVRQKTFLPRSLSLTCLSFISFLKYAIL